VTPQNKKMMELALTISIPDFTNCRERNGRIEGLYKKLIAVVTKELELLPKASRLDVLRIDNLLNEFNKESKWEGKSRHACTLASFCLDIIEKSTSRHNPKITEILNEIVHYYDRKGKVPAPSFWSGIVAANKWNRIMGAEEEKTIG